MSQGRNSIRADIGQYQNTSYHDIMITSTDEFQEQTLYDMTQDIPLIASKHISFLVNGKISLQRFGFKILYEKNCNSKILEETRYHLIEKEDRFLTSKLNQHQQ